MHYKTRLHLAELTLLALCIATITVGGLAVAASTAAAQETGADADGDDTDPNTPEEEGNATQSENGGSEDTNAEEESSIDTEQTVQTIGHVTIHEIRWYPNTVEVDYTAERSDSFRITDFAGERFYWEDYRVPAGTGTITHEFEGDNDAISFAVASEQEGKDLQKGSDAFAAPSTGTFVSLFIGIGIAFLLVIELARRDGRLDEHRVDEV